MCCLKVRQTRAFFWPAGTGGCYSKTIRLSGTHSAGLYHLCNGETLLVHVPDPLHEVDPRIDFETLSVPDPLHEVDPKVLFVSSGPLTCNTSHGA